MNDLKYPRTALFVDGSNFYATARHLDFNVDYNTVKTFFGGGNLLRAYYYSALPMGEQGFISIRPLLDHLSYNGWVVVSKPTKEFERDGKRFLKGNMDIELTIDAMNIAPLIQEMFLFSGDGDFKELVAEVQRKGVRVTVVSAMGMVADELRRQCDEFVDLKENHTIRNKIARMAER